MRANIMDIPISSPRYREALSLLAALLIGVLAPAMAAQANLVKNGDFEQGSGAIPERWTPAGTAAAGAANLQWSRTDGRNKSRGIFFNHAKGDGTIALATEITGAPIGRELRLSGWIKTERAEGAAELAFVVHDPEAELELGITSFDATSEGSTGTTDWHEVHASVTLTKGSKLNVELRLTGRGTARFDDLTLIELGPGKPRSASANPGLHAWTSAWRIHALADDAKPRVLIPIPIVTDDQQPVDFALTEGAESIASARIVAPSNGRLVLDATLKPMKVDASVRIGVRARVAVRRLNPDRAAQADAALPRGPASGEHGDPSACVQSGDAGILSRMRLAVDAESTSSGAMVRILKAVQEQPAGGGAVGRGVDARSALHGRATPVSAANLVAAMARAAGLRARLVCAAPVWSGPVQTGVIVEVDVPRAGWLPVEPAIARMPWEPTHYVVLAIASSDDEARSGERGPVDGGTPRGFVAEQATPEATWEVLPGLADAADCAHLAWRVFDCDDEIAAQICDRAAGGWRQFVAAAAEPKGFLQAEKSQRELASVTTAAALLARIP